VSDDLMTRLRAADPAPAEHDANDDALLAQILASDRGAPAPRRRTRRRRVLILVPVAALLVAGAAFAGLKVVGGGASTANQVRDDYAVVTKSIPLPPGYRWPGLNLEDDSVYGNPAALVYAAGQAECAWWDAWLVARAHGDRTAQDAALRGSIHNLAISPRHPEGASENVGGLDSGTVAYRQRLIRSARADNPTPIRRELKLNCGGLVVRGG
jgi:hypothetical protein